MNDWAEKEMRCNYSGVTDGWRFTAPVGSFKGGESPYGCHDMVGNVKEWCDDTYPGKRGKVIRGGSYLGKEYNKTTMREDGSVHLTGSNLGFRCVVGPKP